MSESVYWVFAGRVTTLMFHLSYKEEREPGKWYAGRRFFECSMQYLRIHVWYYKMCIDAFSLYLFFNFFLTFTRASAHPFLSVVVKNARFADTPESSALCLQPCRTPSHCSSPSFAATSEVGALLAFKLALTIPPAAAAFFATWDAAAGSPCNFTGVTCEPVSHGVVTGISVPGLYIAAASVPFHDICSGLPALATLSLPQNALVGGISGVPACTGLQWRI